MEFSKRNQKFVAMNKISTMYLKADFFKILFFCICSIPLLAQNGTPAAAGARGLAMGNTGLGFQGINSIFSNQAGLADLKTTEVTVFGEQRFFISELNVLHAGIALPVSSGVFGLSLAYFGFDQYNEQKIGLSYSRRLGQLIAISGQIDYLNTRIAEYGNRGSFTFELGVQSDLLDDLTLAAHIYSPVEVKVNEDYSIPSVYRLGLAYRPSDKVMITAEVEQDLDYEASFRGGVEYAAAEGFFLRFGAGSNPTLITLGLGYKKNGLSIDVGSGYHLDLGVMPALSVGYGF